MPYTEHGYWVGPGEPGADDTAPPLRARCGGPGLCGECSVEAVAAGHQADPHPSSAAERAEISAEEVTLTLPTAIPVNEVKRAFASIGIDTGNLLRAVVLPARIELTYVRVDAAGRKLRAGDEVATVAVSVHIEHPKHEG